MKSYYLDKKERNSMQSKTPVIHTISILFQNIMIVSYFLMCLWYQFNLEYDVYKTYTQSVDLAKIGDVKLFQECALMPIYEIKIVGDVSKYDIFQKAEQNSQKKTGNIWDNVIYVDYSKFQKFLRIQIIQAYKIKGQSYFYKSDFRQCQEKDLIIDGVKIKKDMDHKQFFCPDMDTMRNILQLQNSYTDSVERLSFQIEIIACNGKGCKPEHEIQDLAGKLIINNFWSYTQVNFKSSENLGKMPITHYVKFYQQFKLDFNRYRDNNNFVQTVNIKTNDYRDRMFFDEDEYKIYDLIQAMIFTTSKHVIQMNVTTDFKKYEIETRHVLQASFYFLMDQETNHERQVYTFFDLFSQIGGFQTGLEILHSMFVSQITHSLVIGYIMNKLFTARSKNSGNDGSNTKNNNKSNNHSKQNSIEFQPFQIIKSQQDDEQIQIRNAEPKEKKASDFVIDNMGQRNIQNNESISFNNMQVEIDDELFVRNDNMLYLKSQEQFSTFERIASTWYFYPLTYILKKLKYLKNQDKFEEVKGYIENELENTMNLQNSQKIYTLQNQNKQLAERIERLEKVIESIGCSTGEDSQGKRRAKKYQESAGHSILLKSSSELRNRDFDMVGQNNQLIIKRMSHESQNRDKDKDSFGLHSKIKMTFLEPKEYYSSTIKK